MSPENDLIPMGTVCRILGGDESPVVPGTVYRAIREGRLPKPIKIGKLTSRWRRSEIEAFIERAASDRDEVAA